MDEVYTSLASVPGADAVCDRAPFEEFYARELPRLVALARGLCPSNLAEDVAQEAMLVAYRRWREVSELERPDLWVRRTCANLAVSAFRRRVVEVRALTRLSRRPRPAPGLSGPTEEFWTALRGLPRRQAQAAALRFVYDMPVADVAATMGCSVGSVKQHLARARRALAARLELDEEDAS